MKVLVLSIFNAIAIDIAVAQVTAKKPATNQEFTASSLFGYLEGI